MTTKTCSNCGSDYVRSERLKRYEHTVVGCRILLIDSVEQYVCDNCDHSLSVIPDHEDLIAAVASWRVMQPHRLAPRELQLLRLTTGLKAIDFAKKIGVVPETLSRWENGHDAISAQNERYCRIVIGEYLRNFAHALPVNVRSLIDMDFVPFGSNAPVALPHFVHLMSKREERKVREWDMDDLIAA